MVKTPKTRHSKSHRSPVTIELEPGAVSRVEEANASADSGAENVAATVGDEAVAEAGIGDAGSFPGPLFLAVPPVELEWPQRREVAVASGANDSIDYRDLLRVSAQFPAYHSRFMFGSVADHIADRDLAPPDGLNDRLYARRHTEALLRALNVPMNGVFADTKYLSNDPVALSPSDELHTLSLSWGQRVRVRLGLLFATGGVEEVGRHELYSEIVALLDQV